MNHCREIVKKYFSCFPLIYRIGLLITNYSIVSKDVEQKTTALTEAKELFVRVKELSNDIQLKQLALHTEATCEIVLGNPNGIINLLDNVIPPPPHKVILSKAYLMKGETQEAKAELQETIFFNVMGIFEAIPMYLVICADEKERFEEILKRGLDLINSFNLKKLAPTLVLPFFLGAAQGYIQNGNLEKSLEMLESYTGIVTSDIYPIKLVGHDNFFNLIDGRAENFTYGIKNVPRDEKSIKQSMADSVIENPVFSVLSNESKFKMLTVKLANLKEN
jgi:hypothetical protein